MSPTIADNSVLYHSKQSFDFTILLENGSIPAHKSVLTETSQYFRAMFSIGMIESKVNEIRLEESVAKPFELVVKVSYGVDVTEDEWSDHSFVDIFDAIIIANKYQFIETEIIISNVFLKRLKDNSPEYITEEINYRIGSDKTRRKEKFVSILEVNQLAKQYNLVYFSTISQNYMDKKAQEVIDSWKFLYNYWW